MTAADSNYLPAACCTLLSCAHDGCAAVNARYFLLAYDISVQEVENARSFLKNRGASVEIIKIQTQRFRGFRVDDSVTAATYSKLLLSEYFDDRWGRLLYLDADTRVMVRLETLLEAKLHGKVVGAVHDYLQYIIFGMEESRARLGMQTDAPYFNAGVLCFDWPATIASGLLKRARSFGIESAHLCISHDQDALNKAFEGVWAPLDPRWNFMTVAMPEDILRLDYPASLRPYISHFAGPLKPWMANFPQRYENHLSWYREMLRDSPWPYFVALTDAPSSATTKASSAVCLKVWLLAQRRRLRAALELFLSRQVVAARRPQNTRPRKSPSTETSDDEANPELEHLLNLMVAEASSSDT